LQKLKDLGVNDKDVFLDAGCSYNVCAVHIAQTIGLHAWGIEYIPNRNFLGVHAFLTALKDGSKMGPLFNKRVAYVIGDLKRFRHFGTTTVAYIFDEAFDRELYEHNVKACANTPSLKLILSFKASKNSSLHKIMAKYGFTFDKKNKLGVKKVGSNEANTCYFYQRDDTVEPNSLFPRREKSDLDFDKAWQDNLKRAWSGDDDQLKLLYEELLTQAFDSLPSRANGRRSNIQSVQPRMVLLMGMSRADGSASFADIIMKMHGKVLTPQEGRDTFRCGFIENLFNCDVHTLSLNENESNQLSENHICCNFSHPKCVHTIQEHLLTIYKQGHNRLFSQILFDYFWLPNSYTFERWGQRICGSNLKDMAQLMVSKGCIYYPFHRDVIALLAKGESHWNELYNVTLVKESDSTEMDKHLLYKASSHIPNETMRDYFEKEGDKVQLQNYCKVQPANLKDIVDWNDPSNSKLLRSICQNHETMDCIRFIKFEKI
jgi:hypothetical protein